MFIKSLKKHVEQCQQLPVAVRQQQAAQRQRALDRSQVVTQRIRLNSKSKVAPGVFPVPKAAAAPKAAPKAAAGQAASSRTHRRSDDWDPATVRANYQRRYPHRQMSLTDLPGPAPPAGWDTKVCMYCKHQFATSLKACHHSLSCPDMPYSEWLRRVRICQFDFKDSQYCCVHCKTGFATPKAAGRHSVTCGRRRTKEGLSLNSNEFHDL